ncbi:MAG: hypothetical protein MUF31_12195 [Akkermansiaceae bacterium]|nr:hypothetical protein [Akkermansiaceae bacterium]
MPPDMYRPDPELAAWIEALLDQRIHSDDARKLADRLRQDPDAMRYCAELVRFDAAMHDELFPQEIEWTDTRRVVLSRRDGNPELEIERNQSVRVGPAGGGTLQELPLLPQPRRKFPIAWLILLLLAVLSAVLWHLLRESPLADPPPLRLLNGDFEATNLTYLPEPANPALVDWQDYFVTENAQVVEISRVTNGEVLPRSGRNVARLTNYAYLTQRLRRADNSPLLAQPEMKIEVSGWAHVVDDRPLPTRESASSQPPELSLRGSLRFVAGGSPGMVQYELASTVVPLKLGDWQAIRLEFTLPKDLLLAPSYGDSKAKLDLRDKEVTLSLDSQCEHGFQLLLDDLEISETR